MNTPFSRRMSLLLGSLLLTLMVGGKMSIPLPFTHPASHSATAQAQTTPASSERQFRVLSLEELPSLNLSPQLEAFIPEALAAQGLSTHPQDIRGTIGEDDRIELLSRRYPWSAIGRIVSEDTRGSRSICSGTLIASDIVLTNAHCVMNDETGELHLSIQFQPNLVNNAVQDLADVANVEAVFFETTREAIAAPPDANDWAFLLLDQPLGDRYGTIPWMPLPIEELVKDYAKQVVMVGYSVDYPRERPSTSAGVHLGCSILGLYEGSITHDCDTFGGSSGGPILAWIDEQAYIVGVNAAEAIDRDSVIDTFIDGAGNERSVYEGIINFGVEIPRIVEFVEQHGAEATR
jgi:protease YdgD